MTVQTLDLATAFEAIGAYTGLRLDYDDALTDEVGGYHSDPTLERWPIGSMWAVEGQTLYAITRAMRPGFVVEMGTHLGCSASHFAEALRRNARGMLHTCDIYPGAGGLIPQHLTPYVEIVNASGLDYLRGLEPGSVDMVFNDLPQDPPHTRALIEEGRRVLRPGGLFISHDAAHFIVGADIRRGHEQAGLNTLVIVTPPSDCGLAISVMAGEYRAPVLEVTWQDIAPDYEAMTVKELKAAIAERGIDTKARRKAELIAILEGA